MCGGMSGGRLQRGLAQNFTKTMARTGSMSFCAVSIRMGPSAAKSGHIWSTCGHEFDKHWPNLPDFRPDLDEVRFSSAKFGQKWPDVAKIGQNWTNFGPVRTSVAPKLGTQTPPRNMGKAETVLWRCS